MKVPAGSCCTRVYFKFLLYNRHSRGLEGCNFENPKLVSPNFAAVMQHYFQNNAFCVLEVVIVLNHVEHNSIMILISH